jgi:hypothetical protein
MSLYLKHCALNIYVSSSNILSALHFSSASVRFCSVAVQPLYKVRVLVRPARFASYRPALTLDATGCHQVHLLCRSHQWSSFIGEILLSQLCRNLHLLRAEVADENHQHCTIRRRCREKLLPRRFRQTRHGHTKEKREHDQNSDGLERRRPLANVGELVHRHHWQNQQHEDHGSDYCIDQFVDTLWCIVIQKSVRRLLAQLGSHKKILLPR